MLESDRQRKKWTLAGCVHGEFFCGHMAEKKGICGREIRSEIGSRTIGAGMEGAPVSICSIVENKKAVLIPIDN